MMEFVRGNRAQRSAPDRPYDIAVRTLALVLLAAIGLACGGSSPRDGGDASTEAGSDARVEVVPVDECSLVRQDCPTGMMCTFSCASGGVTTSCVPDTGGTLMHGQTCSQIGTSLLCAKGSFCAIFIGLDGGSRQSCNKYCSTSADCPDGLPCMTFAQGCADGPPRALGRCEFAP